MPGSLSHLSRRFLDVLLARPLSLDEISRVVSRLGPAEADLFFRQGRADQRHGFYAMTVVEASLPRNGAAIRAALLHDVAKRHAGLGAIGRTFATIFMRAGLPLSRRMKAYRDHGKQGATELAGLGAEDLVVEFARCHHGPRPESIPPEVWLVLQEADEPPKTLSNSPARIS
ncbi:MAG: hypothetical protein WAN34_12795 [Acidimicrobiia bacterium]